MKVFIANLDPENYAWHERLTRIMIATMNDEAAASSTQYEFRGRSR